MPRNVMRHLIGAALVALLASPIAAANDKDKGPKGKGHKHHGRDTTEVRTTTERHERARPRDVIVIDRDGHRRIITEYFSREGLPPGLAKRQSLPPGLAKQLRERGRLPPGLQKRLTPVPYSLAGRLPPQPPYYSRYFVGRDLVILDRRTQRVVAVIPDVVPG
jgi:hypothetical protein